MKSTAIAPPDKVQGEVRAPLKAETAGDSFGRGGSGETKAPTSPGSLARARAQLAGGEIKISPLLGPYVPLDFHADALKGLALKLAAFLSGFGLTRPLLVSMAERQLQLEELRKLDLSDYEPRQEPAVTEAPAVAATPLAQIVKRAEGPNTISGLHQRYLSGETTPSEIAERFLEAVINDPTSSFTQVNAEQIRADAQASTQRYAQGKSLGPLDGAPIAVKDQLDVKGLHSRVGTSFLGDNPSDTDAVVVKNVRSQGALIVGKTLMNELGFGVNGINPKQGIARNPHDLTRTAGGSSSGAASAVAAELVVAAIGSDAGGSTRLPAALNGLLGLKPTWSRLSNEGNYPLAPSTQQAGPIARTAQDTALLYAAMAGGANLDALQNNQLAGMRIGIPKHFARHADAEVVANLEATADRLRSQGAEVVEIEVNDLNLVTHTQLINYAVECFSTQEDIIDSDPGYGPDTKLNLQLARTMSGPLYTQALRAKTVIAEAMDEAFDQVDVMLTPTSAMTAPWLPDGAESSGASDLEEAEALLRFTSLASVSGHPALTMPTGEDAAALPIGMQLTGKHWDEVTLLRIAQAIGAQAPTPGHVSDVLQLDQPNAG